MIKNPSDNLSERVEQLARLLIWEGQISRARVVAIYGLSPVRASEWIRSLREQFPTWVIWNSVQKRFLATQAAFSDWNKQYANEPRRDEGFSRYLGQVGISPAYPDKLGSVLWDAFPDFSPPPPQVFATLRRAIDQRQAVDLMYRSLQNPAPHHRVIEPHSLVRAGRRWHIRAFCVKNQDFRDYSIGRVVKVSALGQPASTSASDDIPWMTKAKVLVVAHPKLTAAQAEVVRHEYFQGTAARTETCRGALVPYLVQDLRAATDLERHVPPDYQLAVGNLNEVKKWLFPR